MSSLSNRINTRSIALWIKYFRRKYDRASAMPSMHNNRLMFEISDGHGGQLFTKLTAVYITWWGLCYLYICNALYSNKSKSYIFWFAYGINLRDNFSRHFLPHSGFARYIKIKKSLPWSSLKVFAMVFTVIFLAFLMKKNKWHPVTFHIHSGPKEIVHSETT